MKRLVTGLVLLLIAGNAWLLIRQQRVEQILETLRTENTRLAEELAQHPAISPEEFRAASVRLEKAGTFMDAVEGQLTNASALLATLQSASRTVVPTRNGNYAPRSAVYPEPLSNPSFVEATPRPPASSHAPDGQLLQRSWGPEQVVGPPNTHEAGDIPTAWAPLSAQGGSDEWLRVNYDRPVELSEIKVRETYNPGAIAKLAAVMPDGREIVFWEGATPLTQAPVDTTFTAPAGLQAQSVKIYLDRTRAAGWNEIDAVELVARDGTRQWASSATSSTSFAEQSPR